MQLDHVVSSYHHTLKSVLDRLDSAGIQYALLRNRDAIPDKLPEGSDVDIVIRPGYSHNYLAFLFGDCSIVSAIKYAYSSAFYFDTGFGTLRLDVAYFDRTWMGAVYLPLTTLFEDISVVDGIPELSPYNQAMDAWLMNLLWTATVKPKYLPLFNKVIDLDDQKQLSLMQDAFGSELNEKIRASVQAEGLQVSTKFANECRKVLWQRSFRRDPLNTLAGALRYLKAQLLLRFRSPGLIIAIIGPDGSGKSEISSRLTGMAYPVLPFARVDVVHLFKSTLPALRDLRTGRLRPVSEVPEIVTNPHGMPVHNTVLSTVRMVYYIIDQWISAIHLRLTRLSRNQLVIFDRHFLDLRVDPKRFRYGGSSRSAATLIRIAPKPDLVILLDAPAEVLQQRKQEVPFAETERQVLGYQEMVSGMKNGHIVNANQSVEEVVADVNRVILHFMAARTHKRLKLDS